MRMKDIDPRIESVLKEYATAGATMASNIASIPGTLWCGPVKGEYPYVMPDYEAAGLQKMPLRLGQAGATIADKPKKKKKKKKPAKKD